MDSDYAYSSAEESYGDMGSEDEDFDFDSQAEMETHATKVMNFCLWILIISYSLFILKFVTRMKH